MQLRQPYHVCRLILHDGFMLPNGAVSVRPFLLMQVQPCVPRLDILQFPMSSFLIVSRPAFQFVVKSLFRVYILIAAFLLASFR
jgi:hypothetical protein